MTKEQILDFLKQHKQEMNDRFGVTKIGLFGSYVRGEEREDSDIDVAIELLA
jgi:predicted nucleotidyltransferase